MPVLICDVCKVRYVDLNFYFYFSLAGHRVANNANMHFYAASKHATTVLSDGLRNEVNALEKNFRVTVRSSLMSLTNFTRANTLRAECLDVFIIGDFGKYSRLNRGGFLGRNALGFL